MSSQHFPFRRSEEDHEHRDLREQFTLAAHDLADHDQFGHADEGHNHNGVYIADGLVAQDGVTLTDKSLSSVGTFARWGSETVTITDPGTAVTVTARVVGYMDTTSTAGRRVGRVHVGISFDNGVSYDNGPNIISELDRSSADIRNVPTSAQHIREGTPSAKIAVQAEVEQVNGTAGEINFNNGLLVVTMTPA